MIFNMINEQNQGSEFLSISCKLLHRKEKSLEAMRYVNLF